MDNRSLKEKSLESAIKEMMMCKDRDEANKCFKKWEVFKGESRFKEAIKYLKEDFEKNNIKS